MGKVRTRVLGNEEVEEKQKKEQKSRSVEKKASRKKDTEKEKVETAAEVKVESKPKIKKEKKKDEKEKTVIVKQKHSKKHLEAKKKIDPKKVYSLEEAVKLLKKIKYANFDESVELHMNLDAEGLRGEVELPHATGKTVRVKILDDKTLADIEKGLIEFDILISHPSYMPKIAKFAKVLGPKGLMPNPKAGTISPNPEETAKKFAKGTLRWKSELKFPLLHQIIGKISFEDSKITENATAFIKSVGRLHIKKAFIKSTMSPSLWIDIDQF